MDKIIQIPRDFVNVIPKFDGDEKLLSLFIRKCEYLISCCRTEGNPQQDLYVFHIITSRLVGKAAALVSERQDLDTWDDLKGALEQHFGDPRSEECIAIELETLKINSGESYLDFCNRIQHVKSTLIAKVNLINDPNLRRSKIIIYEHTSMNVFLYNLPEELLRIVRLKGCDSLEKALSIVLEEVNFMYQYNSRNKMLKSQSQVQPKPSPLNQNPFVDKFGMKPFFTPNPPNFKFGNINHNMHGPSTSQQPQTQFKFGIPNREVKLPASQPQQFGYRPQQFGYRPQLNQSQQQFGYKPPFQPTGYRPQIVQQQFGYRPPFTQGQQPYRPPQRLPPQLSTDVSMRTAPPAKPQGFRLNEINQPETDDTAYDNTEIVDYCDYNEMNDFMSDNDNYNFACEQTDQSFPENIENFYIEASNPHQK